MESRQKSVTRLALGTNQWGNASYAQDIEPLDGDGTSYLLTTQGDEAANVYDGAVRRIVAGCFEAPASGGCGRGFSVRWRYRMTPVGSP